LRPALRKKKSEKANIDHQHKFEDTRKTQTHPDRPFTFEEAGEQKRSNDSFTSVLEQSNPDGGVIKKPTGLETEPKGSSSEHHSSESDLNSFGNTLHLDHQPFQTDSIPENSSEGKTPESNVNSAIDHITTPFSIRFDDDDLKEDSAGSKELLVKNFREQIESELRKIFDNVLGPNFIDFEITKLVHDKQGNIAEGHIIVERQIADPIGATHRLRNAIMKNDKKIGNKAVDITRTTIDNISLNSSELNKGSSADGENTGYIIIGGAVLGVLILVFSIFAIIIFGVNRRARKMKLRTEDIAMVESGNTQKYDLRANNGVNLVKYTHVKGDATIPPIHCCKEIDITPMILSGSQFLR